MWGNNESLNVFTFSFISIYTNGNKNGFIFNVYIILQKLILGSLVKVFFLGLKGVLWDFVVLEAVQRNPVSSIKQLFFFFRRQVNTIRSHIADKVIITYSSNKTCNLNLPIILFKNMGEKTKIQSGYIIIYSIKWMKWIKKKKKHMALTILKSWRGRPSGGRRGSWSPQFLFLALSSLSLSVIICYTKLYHRTRVNEATAAKTRRQTLREKWSYTRQL